MSRLMIEELLNFKFRLLKCKIDVGNYMFQKAMNLPIGLTNNM
jgi:hypothetical protein